MADEPRPPIPEPMKRQVRQRCGFGCVICGIPLYNYDHIEEYAIVQKHESDNLTLLCDSHHREKTNGLLTANQVRKYDANPYNVSRGISSPYGLHLDGPRFDVVVGKNRFFEQKNQKRQSVLMIPIAIEDIDFVSFTIDSSGNLFLNCQFFDENDQLVLRVHENELSYSVMPWDVEFVGRILTIRQGPGRIFLEIEFRPPNEMVVRRARCSFKGNELIVDGEKVLVSTLLNKNFELSRGIGTRCTIGLNLGKNERGLPSAFRF